MTNLRRVLDGRELKECNCLVVSATTGRKEAQTVAGESIEGQPGVDLDNM